MKLKYIKPIITLILSLLIIGTGIVSWWYYKMYASDFSIGSYNYPGAKAKDVLYIPTREVRPNVKDAKHDLAASYKNGCHQGVSPEVISCVFGHENDYDYTVALVGDSHDAQWLGALETIAKEEKIRIVNMTKSGCSFSVDTSFAPHCKAWNREVIQEIIKLNPDLVFTAAEKSYFNIRAVPPGYLKQFHALKAANIEVFGVRDTPYFRVNVPDCIMKNGRASERCTVKKELVVPKTTDWSRLKNPPSNVHFYDYTENICPDKLCRPVIGNVVAYADKGHMTNTFMKTLAPYVKDDLMSLLKQVKHKEKTKK